MVTNFSQKLKIGLQAEDKFYTEINKFYQTYRADFNTIEGKKLQFNGIDFLVYHNNYWHKIELKNDIASFKTGNFFIETIQNLKQGWVYTTESDYVIIATGNSDVYCITKPEILRFYVSQWLQRYRLVNAISDGKMSKGLLIPIFDFPGIFINKLELANLFQLISARKILFNNMNLDQLQRVIRL